MFFITRREGETLRFLLVYDAQGTEVEIKLNVEEVRGGQVRLGIAAPKSVRIVRGEQGPPDVFLPSKRTIL